MMETIVFVISAAMVLGGGLGVVLRSHPVHAALSMVLALFGVAVMFVSQEAYFLAAKGMAWFWDAYCPDHERRSEPYASPLRASDEQLTGLPPAVVIVDEADVLRDEGEAYAARLRAAGVEVTTVRYDGAIHDFMMLNPLSGTRATRAAIAQAIATLKEALR